MLHTSNPLDTFRQTCNSPGMDIIGHIRASGKTVVQVCREAGVTRQTFYSAIKPGSDPKRKTLKAIADAVGIAMEEIGRAK